MKLLLLLAATGRLAAGFPHGPDTRTTTTTLPSGQGFDAAAGTAAAGRSVTDERARHGRHGRHDEHGPRRRRAADEGDDPRARRLPAHPHRRGVPLRRRLQGRAPRRLQSPRRRAQGRRGQRAPGLPPARHELRRRAKGRRLCAHAQHQTDGDQQRARLPGPQRCAFGAESGCELVGRDDGLGGVHADGRGRGEAGRQGERHRAEAGEAGGGDDRGRAEHAEAERRAFALEAGDRWRGSR